MATPSPWVACPSSLITWRQRRLSKCAGAEDMGSVRANRGSGSASRKISNYYNYFKIITDLKQKVLRGPALRAHKRQRHVPALSHGKPPIPQLAYQAVPAWRL